MQVYSCSVWWSTVLDTHQVFFLPWLGLYKFCSTGLLFLYGLLTHNIFLDFLRVICFFNSVGMCMWMKCFVFACTIQALLGSEIQHLG